MHIKRKVLFEVNALEFFECSDEKERTYWVYVARIVCSSF